MIRQFGVICFFLVLIGCGTLSKINSMPPEQLRTVNNPYNLCNAYVSKKTQSVKDELMRREFIPKDEWALIDKSQITIGMSEQGLACAWGTPSLSGYGSINETVSKHGVRKQWVYRKCENCKNRYVYTVNGKIKSWQN